MEKHLLQIKELHVSFDSYAGEVQAVRGVNLHLDQGEVLAIVGESGSGKTVTANAILKLFANTTGRVKAGSISFLDQQISDFTEPEMESIRGAEISLISQDPMTAINPTMRVSRQLAQVLTRHQQLTRQAARDRAIEMLELVGIPDPKRRANQYPFEFSGGMRQRILIALALSCNPKLVIADEPTTALDVTIQLQILDLLKELRSRLGTSFLLITHDLGVVANMSDRVAVMYAGKIVETASAPEIFEHPHHPYTWGLLESIPNINSESKSLLMPIPGQPPDALRLPAGCAFAPRCRYAMPICRQQPPRETELTDEHRVSCWLEHPQAPREQARRLRGKGELSHE